MVTAVFPFFATDSASRGDSDMSDEQSANRDKSYNNALYPEDQKKVDEFISRGVNSVERKPFRPGLMVVMLITVVTLLSILSQFLARYAGVE